MASKGPTKASARKAADELESKLKNAPFLGGSEPSAADAAQFEKMLGSESEAVARWAKHVASFPAEARKQWPNPKKKPLAVVVSAQGPTKAERKAAFAAGAGQGVKVVAKKPSDAPAEKLPADCLPPLEEKPNFAQREADVLKRWKEINAFETSVKLSEGKKPFTFYDGPPFATGLPHYGHILAGTIKDVVCRWAHQTGHYVERRFGWDCHGLPIEFEIEKEKGIKTSHDVMKIGIKQYNQYCRDIVMKYSTEWENTVTRMGRWIDFRNDYKTMNLSYMESVWWAFHELWDKGLVYQGYKVMPYSIGCTTVLSNFECHLNDKDVPDPSVVVTFPWLQDESISFLAWTTTPWTLPSNLMLCVNPTLKYILIEDKESKKKYIVAESRLVQLYPKIEKLKPKDYPFMVLEEYVGKDLVGREYKPLFNYFLRKKANGAFKVAMDPYVTSDSGTGIVHQAPGFGEDDYRVCLAAGVIEKDEIVPCPVDNNGCYTDEVPDWEGIMVKDADKDIQKKLKEMGRLYSSGTIVHKYPFCWRSEKPLIYKAVSSWFVNVTSFKDRLLTCNSTSNWVPNSVKVGRFTNWLENARDWAVSRNRYWGTPLPIWVSEDGQEKVCIRSVEDLMQRTGKVITDIHRDSIDDLTIPDPRGEGFPPLRRVSEVFDCWFESGSMPYAQKHYPFENAESFKAGFPADFIAEGIDQTRGWFYTLLVLSTAIFNEKPFKNLVVNGLVLAADGRKMSKRERNYPDPSLLIDRVGADALRLYLINSPVVRGQDLRFKEEGVKEVVNDVLRPMYSSLNLFTINYNRLIISGEKFEPNLEPKNIMDVWIVAEADRLITNVTKEMQNYHLYTVVPVALQWVDNLTNCYLRMNRRRLKGLEGLADQRESLATLLKVLLITAKVMAAFTPFMAEQLYQQIKPLLPKEEQMDSVHYLMIPEPKSFDEEAIRKVERLQKVTVMVRTVRDRKGLGLRKPVKKVILIHDDPQYVADVKGMMDYVKEEVNAFEVECTTNEGDYVETTVEGDGPKLGKKFKKEGKVVAKAIAEEGERVLKEIKANGKVTVAGFEVLEEDIKLIRSFKPGVTGYETHTDGRVLVLVDVEQDEQTIISGISREIVAAVQQLRKRAGLDITDKIKLFFSAEDEDYQKAFDQKLDDIKSALGSDVAPLAAKTDADVVIAEQEREELGLNIVLCKA
ncbi:putative isoleucine--tRNA ligase [Diplonema papillatum]|nr:putative isoleucine--tRNA ligase [Diplonema papillatum]